MDNIHKKKKPVIITGSDSLRKAKLEQLDQQENFHKKMYI